MQRFSDNPHGPWKACGLVTLLTDFGHQDTFVGVMKGVLYGRSRALRAVIDLTHEIPPQDIDLAALHLAESWSWFPPGTVHVVVVDPGVGSARPILVAEQGGHMFLAPDNGLLGPLLGEEAKVWRLEPERLVEQGLASALSSRTFHGRDVFAPAAAALVDGLGVAEITSRAPDWKSLRPPAPLRLGETLFEGRIERFDRFGNAITNLEGETLAGGSSPPAWQVEVGDWRLDLAGTYADVPAGAPVALINSSGRIEIAIRDGSAAETLGLARRAPVRLRRRE